VNTDRALIREFVHGGARPLAITSNPLAHDLGGSILELDCERGACVLAFEPAARFVQGAHVLQGGILATMLDFAMAFAAHAKLTEERAFSTATLTVNLLRPATPARYLARGHIVRQGRSYLFAAAELSRHDSAELVATASAVLPLAERR
jgi:uncharacterized protein (TIGR00369 family)